MPACEACLCWHCARGVCTGVARPNCMAPVTVWHRWPKLDTVHVVCAQELLDVGYLRMDMDIEVKLGMNEDLTQEDTAQFYNLFGVKEGEHSGTRFQARAPQDPGWQEVRYTHMCWRSASVVYTAQNTSRILHTCCANTGEGANCGPHAAASPSKRDTPGLGDTAARRHTTTRKTTRCAPCTHARPVLPRPRARS